MNIKLGDTELKVMEVIWQNNGAYAIDIARQMMSDNNWKKNTTYTLISRLIDKGALERIEPNYYCKPIISRQDIVKNEIYSTINKICKGSKKIFFNAFFDDPDITQDEIEELKDIVNKLK